MVAEGCRGLQIPHRNRVFCSLYCLLLQDVACGLGSSRVGVSALVCDNVGGAVAGGQGNQLYEALRCPKD